MNNYLQQTKRKRETRIPQKTVCFKRLVSCPYNFLQSEQDVSSNIASDILEMNTANPGPEAEVCHAFTSPLQAYAETEP
jgi:hypothetical protein